MKIVDHTDLDHFSSYLTLFLLFYFHFFFVSVGGEEKCRVWPGAS
jgi:hypothetical protein